MSESYGVEFSEEALEFLEKLEEKFARQIRGKVLTMAANAESFPHHAMTGDWSGYYRLRSGDYRVVYRLDHANKLILA